MKVHLINPSALAFGVGVITPRWLYVLAGATPKLERDYGATCTWQTDRQLIVSRKGLDARVNIEDKRIHIELSLGFLLTPLSGAIKNGIAKELTSILAG